MKSKLQFCVVLALLCAGLPLLFRGQTHSSDQHLTAHEWGTFTSIAGKDGRAAEWLPLTGSADLPAFVEHLQNANFKGGLRGTVRMETPVLYFYTDRKTTVAVHVAFSQGLITEWYPHANRVEPAGLQTQARMIAYLQDWSRHQRQPDGSISWDSLQLEPGSSAELASGVSENHYFAARETSSTPLRISTPAGEQTEKFLFYRGVASFSVPVSVKLADNGGVLTHNSATQRVPAMILFERRGDKLGFRIAKNSEMESALDPPELNATMESLEQAVESILIAQGLYKDEAQAMLKTWHDSWFEEGSRLLYIVPRGIVDSVLPLTIQPAPTQTVRVFVGRLELVTPATERDVEQALARHDRATLAHYNRFLVPILERMIADNNNPTVQSQLRQYLNSPQALVAQSN